MEGERLCKETAFTPQLWRIQQQLFKLYKETGRGTKPCSIWNKVPIPKTHSTTSVSSR